MIPGLPQVGGMELLILLTIVLLFFGARRIPDLARSLGKGTREFREGIRGNASDKDEVPKQEETPLEEPSPDKAPDAEKVGTTTRARQDS